MAELNRQMSELAEREFNLRSTDFFRPPLKQVGNSIYEIKTHFMSQETVNIIPRYCTSQLAEIKDTVMRHLEEEDCFLYKTSIVTGDPVESGDRRQQRASALVVLMDSLALSMDFEVSTRPNDVICDLFLAICGQPVMVLTIVDGGDKDNRTVRKYNTSVARGLTLTLCKFMDEHISVVFGVLSIVDLNDMKSLRTCLETVVKNSSFVTQSTLTTNQSTHEKIVTAFWAGVAETRSIISSDGRVDTDYLRFLTKDQCVILMENMNKREVKVQFQTGTGATTLMVEVARRLCKLDSTLLVCESKEEKERLKSVFPNTITVTEMPTDLSKYTNIVGETEAVNYRVRGKLWSFIKVYSEIEVQQFQQKMKIFEDETANTEKMILIISSADRRDKMHHLIQEIEILKLFDVIFQGLLGAYDLPDRAALDVLPVKRDSSGDEGRDQRQEIEDNIDHVIFKLKQNIWERRDLFPLLGEILRQMKYTISYLQVKVEYLKQVSSADVTKSKDRKEKSGHSAENDTPSVQHGSLMQQTDNSCAAGESPCTLSKETEPVKGVAGESPGTLSKETEPVEENPGVTAQEGDSDRTNTKEIKELREQMASLKMEAEHKKKELSEISEGYDVEWEYNMGCLSQNMAKLKIQDVILNVIGQDEIPVSTDKRLCDIEEITRTGESQSHVYKLRKLQFGGLTQGDKVAMTKHLITDDQKTLTNLRTQSDHLEHEYGSILYIVGEIESEKSGPVSCPHMELDRDRVNGKLSVSESGELTNVEKSWGYQRVRSRGDQHVRSSGDQHVRSQGDQHVEKFQRYWGTCSRLPLPPSPSTLSVPRYWESKSRLRMKVDVLGWPLLDLGVTWEEKMDSERWQLRDQPGTWCVGAWYCYVHEDICTRVYREGSQCGDCHRNHLSLTPGTGVQTIHWGVVVDMGRGRVGFVDITRGRVLHRFDVNITDSLCPMFGVMPWPDHCEIHTRLLSGAEISMDENKQSLIAKALFG